MKKIKEKLQIIMCSKRQNIYFYIFAISFLVLIIELLFFYHLNRNMLKFSIKGVETTWQTTILTSELLQKI